MELWYRDSDGAFATLGFPGYRKVTETHLKNRYKSLTCGLRTWFPTVDEHDAYPTPEGDMISYLCPKTSKRITTRPGRYLQKFFPDKIHLATEFSPVEVLFATTPDEIERVYREGPQSCMKNPDYKGPCHPARVYGAGDLSVAYIVRDDRITARAVVRQSNKFYNCIYGDEDRLRRALQLLGYQFDEDSVAFEGARLLKIDADPFGYVLPYIDGYEYFRETPSHLIIDDGNYSIYAQNQHGVTEPGNDEYLNHCDYYDESTNEEVSLVHVGLHRTHYWSESAIYDHAFFCDYLGGYVSNAIGVEGPDGELWSPQRFEAQKEKAA